MLQMLAALLMWVQIKNLILIKLNSTQIKMKIQMKTKINSTFFYLHVISFYTKVY